jgi:hypothetical protein
MAEQEDTQKETTGRSRSPKKTPAKKRALKKTTGRGPTWTFPKLPLEEAINVAKAIEDKSAGHPMRAEMLAKALGYNQPDWRFLDLLRAANQYGLVQGTGPSATVTLEPIGRDVVAPSSPDQRQKALLQAFRKVEDFKKVQEHYGDKRIPEDEYFFNTLNRDFGIPRERTQAFADVFTANLRFLRAFNVDADAEIEGGTVAQTKKAERERSIEGEKEPRIREFLDNCFVMMPFGPWFDRYYQEIYVPAIKEAGLEPRRADELFATGSVMEQIWTK